MNLNEDKKAPLREKDLNTKREMVIQYIMTAAKTVSGYLQLHQLVFYSFLLSVLPHISPKWVLGRVASAQSGPFVIEIHTIEKRLRPQAKW